MKIYKVIWRDAKDADETWNDKKDLEKFIKEPVLCESVGYIVFKDKTWIIMAGDVLTDGDYGRVFKVPMGMVKKITLIK